MKSRWVFLLLPFSWLYAFVVTARNKAFDWGLLKTERVGVPVISVGNITVGGTGKTPLVECIVRRLLSGGRRVGIVSRGYGRSSRGPVIVSDGRSLLADARIGGDEPVQIAKTFPDSIVVVDGRRVDAANAAMRLGAQVIVADDGFQHRYLHRDLDIAIVDASTVEFPDAVLPAGRAREPWGGLKRANLVIFSKHDQDLGKQNVKLSNWYAGRTAGFQLKAVRISRVSDGSSVPIEQLCSTKVLAFSGIGNHAGFLKSLRELDMDVVSDMRFRDHHFYARNDLTKLRELKDVSGASIGISTQKDIIRLQSDPALMDEFARSLNLHYSLVEVEFTEGKDELLTMIDKVIAE